MKLELQALKMNLQEKVLVDFGGLNFSSMDKFIHREKKWNWMAWKNKLRGKRLLEIGGLGISPINN